MKKSKKINLRVLSARIGIVLASLRRFCTAAFFRKLTDISVRFKRLASVEEDRTVRFAHARRAVWYDRVLHRIKRFFYVISRWAYAAFKLFLPIALGLVAAVCVAVFLVGITKYTVALRVVVDGTRLDVYAENETVFDEVRERLSTACYENNGQEYYIEAYPTLQMVVVERDKLSTQEELFDAVYELMSVDFGKSYAVMFGDEILGTLKKESEVLALQRTLVSAYVEDVDSGNWEILSDFSYSKGQYPASYETTYEELLSLFTKPTKSLLYTVREGDTVQSIAQMFGLSEPVLKLLNRSVNTDNLKKGISLQVGAPKYSLSVRETTVIEYTQIIPYQTVSETSDELFQGTSEVAVAGQNGYYEITVNVVRINGTEMSRTEVSRTKVREAITQHITVGTKTLAPSGEFLWPLEEYYRVTSYFGMRTLNDVTSFHKGLDIAAAKGTKILAADDGVVCETGWQENGLGNYVKIDHGNGVVTVYGHCSKIAKKIKKGVSVTKGTVIAYVGSTGFSTGNHLHFAIWLKESGTYINPLPYFKTNK